MKSKLLKDIKRIVKETCDKKIDYAWEYHMIPMVKYSLMLADELKADKEIVEISAWLHDISWLRGDLSDNHNVTSAEQAEIILKDLDYPKVEIQRVKQCILSHRGDIPRRTKEEGCIASADTMSHFDAIPALFYLSYKDQEMSIEEGKEWLLAKLERGWKKLIPEARKIVESKYKAVRILLT